jgi:hypothetical protein
MEMFRPGPEPRRPSEVSRILPLSVWAPATLIAAGCSMANLSATIDTRNEPAPELEYKSIVAIGIKQNLKTYPSFGPLEISPIRRTTVTQYGDWMACVKGTRNDRPVYFGVSIKEHKIVSFGESVILDRCETDQYEPFIIPEDPVKIPEDPTKLNNKAAPK